MKHILAPKVETPPASTWNVKWTSALDKKLQEAQCLIKVGSMSQLTGHQALLDTYDDIFASHLLTENGDFKSLTQNRDQRRATWKSYVNALYEATYKYISKLPTEKRPVSNMAARVAAVLCWPPTEEAPPAPLFGPSALDAIVKWCDQHTAGLREVSRFNYCNRVKFD
jgi:hypothetical protein